MNSTTPRVPWKTAASFVTGLLWIFCISMVDWLSGPEISLSVFYLPAIICVAWFSGRRLATLTAVCAALAWLFADRASSAVYSIPWIPFWNAAIRFGFFYITGVLTSEVRTRQITAAALVEQREILKSILDSMASGVLVVGGDRKIMVFNPAAERIFGTSPLGRTVDEWLIEVEELMFPAGPAGITADNDLGKIAIGLRYGKCEVSVRSHGHTEVTRLELTALPLLGDTLGKSGSIIVFNDITSQREMEKQIDQIIESEQRRIGQDLHDGLCQHLVGVAFAAGTLQSDLESRGLPKLAGSAEHIASMINEAISQARSLAHGLYPAGLESGLETALRALADATHEYAGISCEYRRSGPEFIPDAGTAIHLYRIAQEGVTNSLCHATAKHIVIAIDNRDKDFELSISDDGTGIDAASAKRRGIGRNIMQYRANLIGGRLDILSSHGKGTRVLCTAPHSARNA
ncbi:MAG: histidine kinase [Verrucomicrobia bacterium]|nr:histidine kinase [Verrucomicrobiota bacterium]